MAALTALGKITTTGATRKQVTGSGTAVIAYTLVVQALPTNAANVTIGDATVVASTGVGAVAILQPGQSMTIGAGHEFNAANIYFDVATDNDGITGYTLDA